MAIKHKTRVKETASNKPNASTAFSLPGSAATGYRTFASAYANTDQLPYHATNGTDWESGIATFTTGPSTLTRTTILESSNAGAAVDFSAGADVELFVEWPAKLGGDLHSGMMIVTGDGSASAGQTIAASTWTKITNCATVVSDPNSWWDAANTRFKPNKLGVYRVGAAQVLGNLTLMTDAKKWIVMLYKNGTAHRLIARGYTGAASATAGASGMVDVVVDAVTDYFEVYVFTDAVNADNYRTVALNFMTARYVGEL